jgi:site-specific DNA recombinase
MRARRIRVEHSPAVLIGRLFDERGNRMTPTHSNKDGVRYRYYVSHALLQRRNGDAGGVARVPAMPLEKLVVEAVRARTQPGATLNSGFSDREVIDAYVERIVVRPNAIDIELREQATDGGAPSPAADVPVDGHATSSIHATVITLPWSAPAFLSIKGVLHLPAATPTLKQETRDAIVLAIAKARSWIDDLTSGRIQSFTQLAQQEGKVERHIRLLIPLAFTPPQTLAAIVAGSGSTDLTVTALSQAIPYAWRSQVAPNQA